MGGLHSDSPRDALPVCHGACPGAGGSVCSPFSVYGCCCPPTYRPYLSYAPWSLYAAPWASYVPWSA
ncbi:hypothetical protein P376_3691 [Streptomyces sp. HCCB10043]|nr:hypothetical protein P376_3691 [Streptomyces sp. HCCB10043]